MGKKRKFDRVNYIPNQDKYQRSFFGDVFQQQLLGMSENAKRQQQLDKKKKIIKNILL